MEELSPATAELSTANALPTVDLKFLQCTVHVHIHLAEDATPFVEEIAAAVVKNTEAITELANGMAAMTDAARQARAVKQPTNAESDAAALAYLDYLIRTKTKCHSAVEVEGLLGDAQMAFGFPVRGSARHLASYRALRDAMVARGWRLVRRRRASGKVVWQFESPSYEAPKDFEQVAVSLEGVMADSQGDIDELTVMLRDYERQDGGTPSAEG